jgi:2-methylcitrate dehydratase PrpD
LALAALHPDQMLDLGQPAEQSMPALRAFMARVRIAGEETLLAGYPNAWPARIVVTTASGRHEHCVDDVPGDPARPFTADAVRKKFRRCVAHGLGDDDAERLWQSSLAVVQSRDALLSVLGDLDRVMAA